MREDYEITIIGRQTIDAQTDEIQVDTLGDYTERGGAKYISYTEYADEAPYNGQLKVLKIENEDTVTMLAPRHAHPSGAGKRQAPQMPL